MEYKQDVTVLAEYQRLEAEAIWRPSMDAQRRDVIVSIGKATLTLSAPNGEALGHWSIPAVQRLNTGEMPALYGPGGDAPDTLEISDAEMIGAIERVLSAIKKRPPRAGWIGRTAVIAALASFAVMIFVWLPGAIAAYTASLVPQEARAAIGTALLTETERYTGAPCLTPSGERALSDLSQRLFPEQETALRIVPSALARSRFHLAVCALNDSPLWNLTPLRR